MIADLEVIKAEPVGQPRVHPLLFIHGMWEGAWFWRNYLDYFSSRGYACYALNLRGHYGSRPVPDIGKVSIREYLEDAREVAGALGNPVLVGHSMGGVLVQKMAELSQPPATVLMTPAAPRGIFPLNTFALFKVFIKNIHAALFRRPLKPDEGDMAQLVLNRIPPKDRQFVYNTQIPESGLQTFEITVLGFPVDASKVQSPMLVVGGAEDRLTPAGMVRKIARKYGADLLEYPSLAHMMALEPGWEKVARDVADWIERVT